MQQPHDDLGLALRIVRWAAGITGTLYAAFVLLFVIGYLFHPTGDGTGPSDLLPMALYPCGVCLALLAALRWPLAGGLVTCGCLIGFGAWLVIARGDRGVPGPALAAFVPAILYIIYGAFARRGRTGASAAA
jgi:hypothetical protein